VSARMQPRRLAEYLFLAPYTLAFCCFIVLPFIVALALAFVNLDLTSQEGAKFVALGNFREAFADPYFWKAVVATFSYAVLSVPATIALSVALGVGMQAMTSARNVVRALLFLPGMFNVAVAGILWQWFYNREFGLFAYLLGKMGFQPIPFLSDRYLAMPAIVVMTLWWTIGGSAVMVLAALQQIPGAVYEAASIDGAGGWRKFWSISLPMIRPVLLFIIVMNTIGAFQVFGQPFMLTRGGPELVTRGVVQYIYETAFNNYRLGYGAAMSWLLFVIIGIFTLTQHLLLRKTTE
jgi:multiple sugar transport system permease protein